MGVQVNTRVSMAAPSANGAQNGRRLGVIGTSLVQQNDAATAGKISHWNRGWLSWARFFAKGRFDCQIWHDPTVYPGWEPSQVAGSSRFFRGMNAGVSGQTVAMIEARKNFLTGNVRCELVIIDAGTNDMSPLTKEEILAARERLASYYLAQGITVVLLPILSRAVSSWAAGSAERKKAAWINQKTRDFCLTTPNCYLFDWNAVWVNGQSSAGEPLASFSNDGIHFSVSGGVAVGEALANFLARMLPDPSPRVWSQDDKYDAIHNPNGNLLANPFCTGTGGTIGTGVTGTVATDMRGERISGDASMAFAKEVRADSRGDWQVMTVTPGATDSQFNFRTNAADTPHQFPAGTWVQASIECDIGAFNGWLGVTLYLKDNAAGGLISYGLEAFDDGAGLAKLPVKVMNGMIITPPLMLLAGSSSLRWRLEVRVASTGKGASGTGTLKVGAVELRQVADPRQQAGYSGE